MDVVVGLRKDGASWKKPRTLATRSSRSRRRREKADVVMILLPDESQPDVYRNDIAPNLKRFRPGVCPRLQHPLQPDRAAG